MSLLLMSFLLLVLIGLGLVMGQSIKEHFEVPVPEVIAVSPAMANILKAPALAKALSGTVNVDTLEREKEVVADIPGVQHRKPESPACPKCEVCPDMSQYIRLDEVPCWNCTLP
jgi:hypothetical protein